MTTFKTPSAETVSETLRKIPTLQLRRVFYRSNINPNWVKPLFEAGAFNAPEEAVVDERGLIREPYWPEIDYLKDMAQFVPEDVVRVLVSLKDSTNSWIRRAVFEIGANIPPSQAALLVPMIIEWGIKGLGFRSDQEAQATMIRNLLTCGEHRAGMRLADLLMHPVAGDKRKRVVTGIEEYWYCKELPSIAKAMTSSGLRQTIVWLIDYERMNEHLTDDFDITYIARGVIEESDNESNSIEQSLIDAVFELATDNIRLKPEAAVGFLKRYDTIIVRRTVLAAMNRVLEQLTSAGEDTEAALNAACDLIQDIPSTDSTCRVEYAKLVKTIHSIDPSRLTDILRPIVMAGPYGSADIFREKLTKDVEEGVSLDDKLKDRTAQWRHRLLAAIGKDYLPEELHETLDKLNDSLGIISDPLTPMISSSITWVGPVADKSKDNLLLMSAEEIIQYLETWKPGESWQGPTHDGQGREITSLLSTNPQIISGVHHLIDRLRPTYLRALLQGWEAAIKNGITPDWDQLIETASETLSHSDESTFEQEGRDFDDDPNYGYAKKAAMSVLETIARKPKDITIPDEKMAQIAELIINLDPEEAWTDYINDAKNSEMDPLTISLNWRWPEYFRALVILTTHGKEAPWYSDALLAIDRELVRDDTIGASRAVIGERFGNLSHYAPEWLVAHKEELIGSSHGLSPNQEIAFTTLLATSDYYNTAFDLIRDAMTAVIPRMDQLKAGWKGRSEPNQLIGSWIIHAFIWGHVEYDDPIIQSFFENSSAENTGDTIGHIAWAFMQSETVDSNVAKRLGELWDLRVAYVKDQPENIEELSDFYWFIRSNKYEPEWWLPRLIEAAQLHDNLNTHGMIGEILASVAIDYPRDTLTAITLLLDDKPDVDMLKYDLREHAAPEIIATCLISDNPKLINEAKKFMNDLGSWGYIDLEDRVNTLVAEKQAGNTSP